MLNDPEAFRGNPIEFGFILLFVSTIWIFSAASRISPGLEFWVNNIAACGVDTSCREAKRIDTSAAYFLSIEFQETGYLAERLYKASYGDAAGTSTFGGTHQISVPMIRFNEFLPDTASDWSGRDSWKGRLGNGAGKQQASFHGAICGASALHRRLAGKP